MGALAMTSLLKALSLSVAAVIATGAVGWFIGLRYGRRSLAGLSSAVVILTLAMVAVGIATGMSVMMTTPHDIIVVVVVLAAALLVAAVGVRWVNVEVRRSTQRLAESLVLLGSESDSPQPLEGSREVHALGELIRDSHERVVESRRMERLADRSRRDLIAWVSHDLRTPLAGLRAMAEALEDGVVSDPVDISRYHSTMRTEVDHLSALVGDLFELARLQAGVRGAEHIRVSMADLVSDVLASTEALADDHGVKVMSFGADSLPVVKVNVSEINRALRNLLDNAIGHTPDGGSVCVRGWEEDAGLVLAIEDSCGGIPEADLARVFDVAFRGEPSRSRQDHAGAGLGLAVVKAIVEGHDGEVSVENYADGCRFRLRLPLTA